MQSLRSYLCACKGNSFAAPANGRFRSNCNTTAMRKNLANRKWNARKCDSTQNHHRVWRNRKQTETNLTDPVKCARRKFSAGWFFTSFNATFQTNEQSETDAKIEKYNRKAAEMKLNSILSSKTHSRIWMRCDTNDMRYEKIHSNPSTDTTTIESN